MSQNPYKTSLLGGPMPGGGLLSPQSMPAAPRPDDDDTPPPMRAFGDVDATRQAIYDNVFNAASQLEPVSNPQYTLKLSDVGWSDAGKFTKQQHKLAVLRGDTLGRRLSGTWQMYDNATGKLVDQKRTTVMKVPWLTPHGTFVYNGTEYVLRNQQRLRPGVFVRRKDNGELEAHANVLENGPPHRYYLDPDKGTFHMMLGQAKIPVFPLLRALGATDEEMKNTWGQNLYATNYADNDAHALSKIRARLKLALDDRPDDQVVREQFEKMALDPEVTGRTLGKPYTKLDKDAILATTAKLLAISRGSKDVDDRDALPYQTFMGAEDLFAERLKKDRAGTRRQLLYKLTRKGNLSGLVAGALQEQIDSAIMESGLGQGVEEINPSEIFDKNTQITRLGEGGIENLDSVPAAARAVQPTQLGFVDPLRTPESERAGVDVFMASGARKGLDGKIYTQIKDLKTGKMVWRTPQQLVDHATAFPGGLSLPNKRIPAMVRGRLTYVPKDTIRYELPPFENAFSPLGNVIPLKSMVKGQRVAMASRMTSQALPLINPEAPLVQAGIPGSGGARSYEDELATHMGAVRASRPGRVISVTPDEMVVRYDDTGKNETIELYNNFAYNRKTGITQTPSMQPGQRFEAGQVVARSNYTTPEGTAALGANARVAYTSFGGKNYEDAIVISDSMAKRLTSEHVYQHDLEKNDRTRLGRNAYLSLFPARFDKATLANMDDNGLAKPGTVVQYGDPLILGAEERANTQNKVHKKNQAGFRDVSVLWEHQDPGIVQDVVDGRTGPVVVVRSQHEMRVGDKLSGRYGDKGVISAIVSDAQMPHDKQGRPFEVLLSPLGVTSRTNPAQVAEAGLGKIARLLGKPIKVEDFDASVPDRIAWLEGLLQKHGLTSHEDIVDPETGNTIPGVLTGDRFFMKLHHMAESKLQGRDGGAYTSEEAPAKGGYSGSKRMSLLDLNAIISHGAPSVLRDAGSVRGQKNDEYWLQFMQGLTPQKPRVPLVYTKFVNELKASGINVVRDGPRTHIMAMTDKDVDALAGDREISSADTVEFDGELKPIAGGLFDPTLTGGHGSPRWAAIKLAEPLPNPVMEEPIRRVLGLTKPRFEAILSGQEELNGKTGSQAIASALSGLNVETELAKARFEFENGTKTGRDAAVRRLGYLKSAQKLNIHPGEWMLKRVPVLPPQFRPVSIMGGTGVPLVADPNYLYKELFEANKLLQSMKEQVGDKAAGPERLATYNAFKAVTGLGEPTTTQNQERAVRGILKSVFGSSPKLGTMQRKLLSSTVDNVGRGVVIPDPDLDIDSVGLPEEMAFDIYGRFVARQLRRSGVPLSQALEMIRDRHPLAKRYLASEMEERPVLMNRAPVLHRFGLMAFKPRLVADSVIHVSPLVTSGLGMDFDGNCIVADVEVCLTIQCDLLTLSDVGRQFLSALEERVMRITGDTGLVWQDGATKVTLPVAQFPYAGPAVKDRNGADVYAVPAGVTLISYDHAAGRVVESAVTHFTVEARHTCVRVSTERGRTVGVSDNESLALYDHNTGALAKCKPADALGRFAPAVRREPITGTSFDFDTGWWYGVLIADGWVRPRMVGYAKNEDAMRARFVCVARATIHDNFIAHDYKEEKNENRFADGAKVHLNGAEFAGRLLDIYTPERAADQRGALAKRIPPVFFERGSREALLGLFSGLIDGDCTHGWNTARANPRPFLKFNTSSAQLRDDIVRLCRLLGVRASVTTMKAKARSHEAYIVLPSLPDLKRLGPELRPVSAAAVQWFQAFLASDTGVRDDTDVVPMPVALVPLLATLASRQGDKKLYGLLRGVAASATPALTRAAAQRVLACIAAAGFTHELLPAWRAVVAAQDVVWDRVTALDPLEDQPVYDFVLAGEKVFMISNGLIVYDTSQIHVPADPEAVREANERMLPSRQLLSPADFKTPAPRPTQDYVGGLYEASTAKSTRAPHTMRNAKDVIAAWRAGKLDLGDVVRTLE